MNERRCFGDLVLGVGGKDERMRLQEPGDCVELEAKLARAMAIDCNLSVLGLVVLHEATPTWIELVMDQLHDVIGVVPPTPQTRRPRALGNRLAASEQRHAAWQEADVTPLLQIDDGRMLNQLVVWAPDSAARRKILVDNPARPYGF